MSALSARVRRGCNRDDAELEFGVGAEAALRADPRIAAALPY